MKSTKLTNTLLALIFLVLLAHFFTPFFKATEAGAAGSDSVAPSAIAAGAAFPALDQVAKEVSGGLRQIAQSNQQIADAIRDHARSSERIAQSLERVAGEVGSLQLKARTARPAPMEGSEVEEQDPDWWKEHFQE
ncbi:MAG: hypothetical protein HQ583_03835 [Candidatus Abyssubacteria bacterium]|nr:hypothetical protein [Candidatus Abyssubacteria bacterium]